MTRKARHDVELEEFTHRARETAVVLSDAMRRWARPRIEAAVSWAQPRVEDAWRKGVTAAAPKVTSAASFVSPKVDALHDKLVDELIPGVVSAVNQAAVAAAEAAAPPAKKGGRFGRFLLWLGVGGFLAGTGYLIWRQTRPLDDPWADEEWDLAATSWEEQADALEGDEWEPRSFKDSAGDLVDKAQDAVGDAAEAVGEAAGVAVKKTQEATKKATAAVKRAAKKTED